MVERQDVEGRDHILVVIMSYSFQLAVAPDQIVGGTVVFEFGLASRSPVPE